jgi:starch-binding outer membrane protein, SusD/RagB family
MILNFKTMIRKYILYCTAAALTLGTLSSCDKQLDIAPFQNIDQEQALATDQDVKVTLIGAYDALGEDEFLAGTPLFAAELMGDDAEVRFAGTFATLDEIWRKTITTVNADVRLFWEAGYISINRANNVLAALDKVNAADKARIEGEARFIRGVAYFEMVRLFGKTWGDGDNANNPAVPLVLTPTRVVSASDNVPRASVAAVYAQVIDDLTKAEGLLAASTAPFNTGFATKNAAAAMLSRVYLMQANYAAARDAANRVITSARHALAPTYAAAFADATFGTEPVFRIIITDQDGINDMNTYYAGRTKTGRGDIRIQQKHLALYDAADQRGKLTTVEGSNTFTSKFNDRFGDVVVIRYAEMLLTRAEANFRLNAAVGAAPLDDINAIRTRAGLPALTAAQLNIDAILKERRLELAHEGHQLHDLKRTRRSVGTKPFSDNSLVMPIPQREIDTNSNLRQNPGY